MKRLTGRTDIGDSLLDEIAFINPDDAEGLYNLREIAQHGSDELLYEIANRLAEYEDTGLEPEKIVFLKNIVCICFSCLFFSTLGCFSLLCHYFIHSFYSKRGGALAPPRSHNFN